MADKINIIRSILYSARDFGEQTKFIWTWTGNSMAGSIFSRTKLTKSFKDKNFVVKHLNRLKSMRKGKNFEEIYLFIYIKEKI